MSINRMLINATQEEEIRVAQVNGSRLDNLAMEHGDEQQKANVYKGKFTRIERSLEAVFVDYGAERHGFLPFREIAKEYLRPVNENNSERTSIGDRIFEGQEVIIQVEKESRGNKGAALTTFISLAGCYLVLMPNNPKAAGISRRIDGEERAEVREVLGQLTIPAEMGVIVRTAGMGRDIKDLQWDLDVLVRQWTAIETAAKSRSAPFLIYQESSLIVRAIRDYLRPDIHEILIDSPKVFEEASMHIRTMRPDFVDKVKLYNDSIPLFSRFQIESQIEMAFQREVTLPSGGAIVIDHTEALISIDINSARSTRGGDIEETAYHTNLEAADEIARQLRLRDIGGLIVIDFIDMSIVRNQKAVEQRLKDALVMDRARIQVGRISRFGLLEMSRQRLRPPLSSGRDIICPRCLGQGTIRGVEVLALNMLRLLEEEAIKDGTAQVQLELPVEVATYLINEKRQAVLDIERKHHIKLVLIPSTHFATPNYTLKRIKKDDSAEGQNETASYALATKPDVSKNAYNKPNTPNRNNVPAVSSINASNMATPQKRGIIRRFLTTILGNEEEQPSTTTDSNIAANISTTRFSSAATNRPQNSNNRNRNNRNRNNNRNKPAGAAGESNTRPAQPPKDRDNRENNRDNNRENNRENPQQAPIQAANAGHNENAAVAANVNPNASVNADGTPSQPRKRTGQRRHQYRKRNNHNKQPQTDGDNTSSAPSAPSENIVSKTEAE